MSLLILTLLAFGIVHLVPAIPRAKAWAKLQLGKAYGAVYGIISLILLIAAVWAFRGAEATSLYDPPAWGRHANFLLTLIAFILLGVFLFRGSLRNRLQYPMALAVTFWAAGHLLANGDTRTTVFFLGFFLIAMLQAFLASRLNEWTPTPVRGGHDVLSLVFGVALYGVATQLHPLFAGVPVLDIAGFAQ